MKVTTEYQLHGNNEIRVFTSKKDLDDYFIKNFSPEDASMILVRKYLKKEFHLAQVIRYFQEEENPDVL